MSTAAISETAAPATLLVVRNVPAPARASGPPPDSVVNLFDRGPQPRKPRRITRGTSMAARSLMAGSTATAGARGTPSTSATRPQARNTAGASGTLGTVHSLDPEQAERAVVSNMSCKVAQSALEILNGVRSVQQLARWLDARCLSALTTRARLHARACRAQARRRSSEGQIENVHLLYRQPRVHSVHCFAVTPGVFETAVIVADKTRFRAIAMRLELSKGMWKVTALRIG
ncbi:Rv3235 family protein [Arthrobacter sp. N199823]|uniref:Rv3235 family protein n=1 Tax=unclassified Arthrobacter TaxID=235627 RepID=UPI000CE564C5|nr:Rv3235 family protein [Arthrobacter sp. N199823]